MHDALYAMYLGTFVTLAAAIRRSNQRLARQIIGDALCLCGEERFAQLIAIGDASIGVRRSKDDLVAAVRDRVVFTHLAVAT
jgi:hypothetical protein